MDDLKLIILFLFYTTCKTENEVGDIDLGCPRRSYRFGDFCYWTISFGANFHDSEKICELREGRLVAVKDEETYFIVRKMQLKLLQNFWIGLNDRKNEGEWIFSDGMRLQNFNRWSSGEPNNILRNQHCAVMSGRLNFFWDDEMCDRKFLYICQFEGTNCTKKDGNVLSPYCFELSEEVENYDEADMICRQKGGYLVNVKTKSIHDFLKRLILADKRWKAKSNEEVEKLFTKQNSLIPTVWIGLTKDNEKWFFSDGSVLGGFKKWNEGEPNNVKGDEICVSMRYGWTDEVCNARYGSICQFRADGIDSSTLELVEDVFPVDKLASEVNARKDAQVASNETSGLDFSINQFACLLLVFFLLGSMIPLCGWCLISYSAKTRRGLNYLTRRNDDNRLEILENDVSQYEE